MLDVKKSNSWTMEEVYKEELDIMTFKQNEFNFDSAFDDHQNTWKCSYSQNIIKHNMNKLKMIVCRIMENKMYYYY